MNNERDEASKRFHALSNEVIEGYAQIMAEQGNGTVSPASLKARKQALAVKEKEMKRLFEEAKRAGR